MLRKQPNLKSKLAVIPLFAIGMVTLGDWASTATAEQVGGRSYFDHAPRLTRSAVSNYTPLNPSTYQFTISVPSDAGAALQTVKIVQEPNLDRVHFNVANSSAFLGNSFAGGQSVPLAALGGDLPQDATEATVTFNPPIQPGQTVTVVLDASKNPWLGGSYLFGVTAYPEGNQNSGLFLGFGRIQFPIY